MTFVQPADWAYVKILFSFTLKTHLRVHITASSSDIDNDDDGGNCDRMAITHSYTLYYTEHSKKSK